MRISRSRVSNSFFNSRRWILAANPDMNTYVNGEDWDTLRGAYIDPFILPPWQFTRPWCDFLGENVHRILLKLSPKFPAYLFSIVIFVRMLHERFSRESRWTWALITARHYIPYERAVHHLSMLNQSDRSFLNQNVTKLTATRTQPWIIMRVALNTSLWSFDNGWSTHLHSE